MKVIIKRLDVDKDADKFDKIVTEVYEAGPRSTTEKYWKVSFQRAEARVHDLENGELTQEIIEGNANYINNNWGIKTTACVMTEDAETGKPIMGYCFPYDHDKGMWVFGGRFIPHGAEE